VVSDGQQKASFYGQFIAQSAQVARRAKSHRFTHTSRDVLRIGMKADFIAV